jgi:TonB family protein
MNSFIEYIAKSGLSLIVFYLFYWLLMRNDTHFRLNRMVLLLSVIVSLLLPVFSFFKVPEPFVIDKSIPFIINFEELKVPSGQTINDSGIIWNFWKIISIIYASGAIIALARLVYQAIYMQAVSKLSEKDKKDGYTIVSMTSNTMPFSYFKKIFIPVQKLDDFSLSTILSHEKSHMMQYHYLDLFLIEAITIFQWFNPIVWLYEKSLKEVHEYLADDAVLGTGENKGKYQAILVNQALGGPVFIFTNQFNNSLIKKRISMMNKIKNSRLAQLKSLYVVPLVATLLVAFANPQITSGAAESANNVKITGNVTDKATGKALEGVAIVIKGTTEGTITGLSGDYAIDVSGESSSLVYSCVGYRTQVITVGSNTKINVELEENALELDFSKGNMLNVTEEKRWIGNNRDNKTNTHVIVEENPSYPGGTDALLKFITSNMQYPENAKKNGIKGIVYVQYIVDKEGKIKQAKILRGVSPELDKEALRLTQTITGWNPAMQNGNPVERALIMPIKFSL